jgi:ATP-dependent RNA helicase DeaD
MNTLEKFRELGISESILVSIKKKGFEVPSPIQTKIIPEILNTSDDLIGQAQTGTGKTAAFGIPIIQLLSEGKNTVKALILTPTRELCIQVAEELNSLKGKKKTKIIPVYGGQSIDLQIKRLEAGVDIVVGTPGRIIDHINRKKLDLSKIEFLVLDEADEMLNMGFIEDIEFILKNTNKSKRTFLFSATMPKEIKQIAQKYMKNQRVIAVENKTLTTDLTDQIYFEVNEDDKFEALCRIRDIVTDFYGIVFCRTKIDVDNVTNKLLDRGYSADALHGDISQYQRERILKKFKEKKINILVATDVAARGIDISDLTHVINYSLPQDPESYVHRIGRTGRAGKEGTAITFVTPEEYRRLVYIMRIAKAKIKKGDLPKISDIIETKKSKIIEEIKNTAENLDYYGNKHIDDVASELLDSISPEKIIKALLSINYNDEFDESTYSEIADVKSINKKGKARLFVSLGKENDFSPKTLVDFIYEKTGVEQNKLREVKVFDKFSFVTAPYEEAEVILSYFKKHKKGKRPIVEIAKEKRS